MSRFGGAAEPRHRRRGVHQRHQLERQGGVRGAYALEAAACGNNGAGVAAAAHREVAALRCFRA
eukprot:11209125-Lingulodinium_polyedra.AAC.1